MRLSTLVVAGGFLSVFLYVAFLTAVGVGIYLVWNIITNIGLKEMLTNIWCGPLGC